MAASSRKELTCAIYTRKSSEEGLEQEFNSLDAQREACEAYIRSQRHEGWRVLGTDYDDGGFSGGNMERPGLVRLLADIKARKIDVVVVYKVDRLTRALSDFAKIVEAFDAHGVSFVSVTQQFNTTTSMGRLTLNVLLSFAQFEREVTGERIRDKIAASRRKGMWMGGNIPLGYDLEDHKLVVNEREAETIKSIFGLYNEFGCVRKLKSELETRDIKTKSWISGTGRVVGNKPFSRGHLYYLLRNRVYLGEAVHRGVPHAGQHAAIIDQDTWQQTQTILDANRVGRKQGRGFANPSLLAGILFDEKENRLTPSHTGKKGARYRYYVSQALLQEQPEKAGAIKRVPAAQIEGLVRRQIVDFLSKPISLAEELCGSSCDGSVKQKIAEAAGRLVKQLESAPVTDSVLKPVITKVILSQDSLEVHADRRAIRNLLQVEGTTANEPPLVIKAAAKVKSSGRPAKMLIGEFSLGDDEPEINDGMVRAIARAHKWNQEIMAGRSMTEIAKQEAVDRSYVSQTLPLAFLAPDITEAILEGRQPSALKVEHLLKPLPIDWPGQRQVLGFPAR